MITVVHNKVNRSLDLLLDAKGIDLLVQKLQALRVDGGHLHIYGTNDDEGVSTWSPYRDDEVYGEIVLSFLPSAAWDDTRPE